MEKIRQKILSSWLKQQEVISRRLINISRLLGLVNGILIIFHSWMLARILQHVIIEETQHKELISSFLVLLLIFTLRACNIWLRERIGFYAGQNIRHNIRRQVLDRLAEAGPAWIQKRPTGSWASLILEQIEDMHDYYSRYLPQMASAISVPISIVIAIFPINWGAALILLLSAPLIPIFMVLVGTNAADANRRNFTALARLSAYFLDRLRGIETLKVFDRGTAEIKNIHLASQDFRHRTMEVLRLAFLSSGVLEFFTSLSIAIVAAYFGFSYLGVLHFGHYNTPITLSAGFLTLILAPEFFQPLRDLGTFYHAKAQAVGAADSLKAFLETPLIHPERGNVFLKKSEHIKLIAKDFSILSPEGKIIVGPINFTIFAGQRVAIVGTSGSGKSSLLNAISGFMIYTGSLLVNGIELRSLEQKTWRAQISWIGQNPQLPAATLRDNVLLGNPNASSEELKLALDRARVNEFIHKMPKGIETTIRDQGSGLSVGQAQRIAVARALIHPCRLLLLDEPTSSLDVHSEQCVMQSINEMSCKQTTLMVTHHLENIIGWDNVLVMERGLIVDQSNFSALSTTHKKFY